jgi:hypothetical protein
VKFRLLMSLLALAILAALALVVRDEVQPDAPPQQQPFDQNAMKNLRIP